MSGSNLHRLSRLRSFITESAWVAYLSILLLQVKVMLWIWEYRDLAPGDTSSYYAGVVLWLDEALIKIGSSPVYTLFLASLHSLLDDPFRVLTVAQISIAICASLLTLALLRRLLPEHIAWIIAAWWVLLPINFDTVYSVHLFSALFPLMLFVTAACFNTVYGRGIVLAGLLLTTVLVRNEYGALFLLWLCITGVYELYIYRKKGRRHSLKSYIFAYGLPILLVCLLIGIINTRSVSNTETAITTKGNLTFCQSYASNRLQQADSWKGNQWTECQVLIERDFGRPDASFSQAFFANPRAMLKHIWWNIKLIPSGTQVALFNHYSSGANPSFIREKQSSLVWVPFLLVLGLSAFGAITSFIIPGQNKSQRIENKFVWLLMLSTALLVLGIIMMVKPWPSYMFPYALFIMALTGLGLHQLFERMRMSAAVKACCPIAGILLIVFIPSHYNADYTNHFGYKGQKLRNRYTDIASTINRTAFTLPAVVVVPMGEYSNPCNYLGLDCLTQDLEGNRPADIMVELFNASPADFRGNNVYTLYLEEMIWNTTSLPNRYKSASMNYVEVQCLSPLNNVMQCSDGTIDLGRGVMNDGTVDIPLRAALFVNDGYVVDRKNYRAAQGYYLQVLMKNNAIYMTLVAGENLFRTNFNQQFLLGNYDRRYFEEVYNNFPAARVLKIKKIESAYKPGK